MLRLVDSLLWAIGRLYGVFFLAIAGLFFFWSARGLLAYLNGVRAAWSEPAVCLLGFVIGGLSLWVGVRLMRRGIPRDRKTGAQGELEAALDAAVELEHTDPAAAYQLLDHYFVREAAATEARREELRQRASHNRKAAAELREELQNELVTNEVARHDLVKRAPADQRATILAQIDASDRDLHTEIRELDNVINRLPLP